MSRPDTGVRPSPIGGSSRRTLVTRVSSETFPQTAGLVVTIEVTRGYEDAVEPDASDYPDDVREALSSWLEGDDAVVLSKDDWRLRQPDPATDQLHGAEIRSVVRKHLGAPSSVHDDLIRELQAIFDRAYFQPTGDNHHNANACPYCRGERGKS